MDVGASWGAYSHAALARGLVVYAFEPQIEVALVLQRGLSGAVIRCAAVSDHTGETELRIPRNDIGYATVELRNALSGTADLSKGMDRRCVPTIRLDDVDLGRVSLLKVDVEGHELAVLRGARELLEVHRPMLIIEVEERHAAGSREHHLDPRITIELAHDRSRDRGRALERRCTGRAWQSVHDCDLAERVTGLHDVQEDFSSAGAAGAGSNTASAPLPSGRSRYLIGLNSSSVSICSAAPSRNR